MLTQTISLEDIHAYFRNELPETDQKSLEDFLASNVDFAEQVSLYRHVYEGHDDPEIQKLLFEAGWPCPAVPLVNTTRRLWLGLAASLLIMAGSLVVILIT